MSKARSLAALGNAYDDGALSNRNLLINNDFRIWQRGTIFYGGAGNWSYTADRWQAGYTATTEKITGGLKMTIGSNTVGNQLFQIVENIDDAFQRNFDTYTATVKFKAPVGVTVALYVKNWGNGWAELFSGSVAATGNEQTLTVSGPSSDLVSGGNPYFNLLFNGATTGQVIEVYDTQLEGGDTATPFEHRSYGQELALCQRYYQYIDSVSVGGSGSNLMFHRYADAQNMYAVAYKYFTPMRTAPSITFESGIRVHLPSYSVENGTFGASQVSSQAAWIYVTPTNNNSAVKVALIDGDGVVSKKVFFDAEL